MRDLVAGGQIEVHALATEVAQTLLHESLERGGKLRGKEKGGKLRGKEVDRGEKNKQLEAKRWGTKGKCVFSYFIVIIIKSKQLVAIVLVLLPSSPLPPFLPLYHISLSLSITLFLPFFLSSFLSYRAELHNGNLVRILEGNHILALGTLLQPRGERERERKKGEIREAVGENKKSYVKQ